MPKQFSLRLLLVVVTALCIALGVWIAPRERQRQAVKAIWAAGGAVDFVARDPESEPFLLRWLPGYFDDIDRVWLTDDGPPVKDDVLAHLEALPKTRYLWLSTLTDAGVIHLEGLTDLELLSLNGTQITNAGLAHLQGLTNLRKLWLDQTQVTDAGLV